MSTARADILKRIAAAAHPHSGERAPSRAYRRAGTMGHEERVELFCRRVGEYRSEVHQARDDEVAALIASVCRARGIRTLVVPDGLPHAWRNVDVELVDDHALSAVELSGVGGALTGCSVAIAETGTIILTGSPEEGRRALTLVPDVHICVVRASQIVELPPEALARLTAGGLERRPITLVSGPSATSDIELSRVEGVHGPRTLVILVVDEDR